MIGAWDYVQSAMARGLTSTEGLREYRDGGGSIRNQSWNDLTSLARDTVDTGDRLVGQEFETPIPGSVYSIVGDDYGHKYVVVSDVSYTDAATGQTVKRTVTVESDEERSWQDIEDEINDVVSEYGVAGGFAAIHIGTTNFLSPQWIEW
jgi:hypothetical protein